ncbi:MAG: hypothetical protein ACXWDM_01215 [Nocardioides sp.]
MPDLEPARRLAAVLALTLAAVLALVGCGADEPPDTAPGAASAADARDSAQEPTTSDRPAHEHSDRVPRPRPLRAGETRATLTMAEAYTPSAPTGVGTDDYRCFLLDPKLEEDTFLTGTNVLPGNSEVVHHVILFRVPPDQVETATSVDAAEEGPGWTCFGGSGLDDFSNVDDAEWLGAWAPGGRESVQRPGLGVPLAEGSQIVMQVHYNLLAGDDADVSATQLRMAPAEADITPLETMLMPAPVELPCRPDHDSSPLCDRGSALADLKRRVGDQAGATADALYLLCGGMPDPGPTQGCTRTLSEPMTIQGVAGHMHLLGRSITLEVNPETEDALTVLDIPSWNFDDQAGQAIPPVRLDAGDSVRVTCRHDQRLRDVLPAFEGQDERYVVWGEGTTDEMCLGILQVTRP